ncbi:MAG TPA: carboxypeptidase-like regulatory domain-containing protein, partial [Longimicrobium sp.]|nr:carboxypeptidase-like regulatory domain-containing protein [Longimicrobium sp.]
MKPAPNPLWLPVLATLAMGCVAPAQAQAVRIVGRVVDGDGSPIQAAKVSVYLAGQVSGAGVVGANGAFDIVASRALDPAAGCEVRAERIGYVALTVGCAEPSGGVIRMPELRLSRRAVTLAPVAARAARPAQRPPQGNTPGGGERGWDAFATSEYPVEPGDLADFAGRRPGVVRVGDEGEEVPRLSIGGQDPSRAGLTLDGAGFGASTIPSEALRSVSVVQSTYDPGRGQFSSGQVAATTRSGTNVFGGAFRGRGSHPLLQAGGGGGAGSEPYALGLVSGGAGGPLVRDRAFWFAAVQATQRSTPFADLGTASATRLGTLGVDPDSAARFRALAARSGLVGRGAATDRVSRRGSALLRTDAHLTPNHTLSLRLDARASRTVGLGGSPLSLGTGGRARMEAGGVLGQLASYLGDTRNELRVYASRESRRTRSGSDLPSAYVSVGSTRGDGAVQRSQLRYGGPGRSSSVGRSTSLEVADEALVGVRDQPHRLKLGVLWSADEASDRDDADPPGAFFFRSLADFDAGRPSLLTRTLGGRARRARSTYGTLFAAHFWRVAPRLWLIDGVRMERTAIGDAAAPSWSASPRVGFTAEGRNGRWELYGGAGSFVARHALAGLQEALAEADTAGAARELVCIGAAAPGPRWREYAAGTAALPTACADGAPLFSARLPQVTAYAAGFAPPRSWRTSLGGNVDALQSRALHVSLHGEAELSLGFAQPVARDVNLRATPFFVLGEERGRPVYVPAGGIDPESGAASLQASRVDGGLGVLRRVESSGRSRAVQVTVGSTLLTRRLDLVSLYYTYTRSADQASAVPVPGASASPFAGADPRRPVRGPSEYERRHVVLVQGIYPLSRWLELGAMGRGSAGMPFSPLADADVNGDGTANDPAFVFDPSRTADPAVAEGMRRLLREPGAAGCLRGSLDAVAERNRCTTPWTWSLDVQANVKGGRLPWAPRLGIAVVAANVIAGIDQLLHGAAGLRGWGDPGFPDPVLLHVRGFDPAARAYRYEVNPQF